MLLIGLPIVGLVVAGFIVARNEELFAYLKVRFRKSTKDLPEVGEGKITRIDVPYELRIDGFTDLTATFHGTVKRGFFSCQIKDCIGRENWGPARTTLTDLDSNRQTGNLSFRNEKRTITWPIKPEPFLIKGKGKLVGVFEERDIIRNGQIIENHPPVALKEKEVLLV